jgi:quercetin dioxygenase-like cupin family protein
MIVSNKVLLRSCLCAAAVGPTAACATAQQPPPTSPVPAEIRVLSSSLGEAPAVDAVTRTTVYENPRTVTQVLRIASRASIAQHHHPSHDETFLVQQGRLTLTLDGKNYDVGAGEFVVMPAGTVISGTNTGDQEARVVVAFSSTGAPGPLTVPGAPHH